MIDTNDLMDFISASLGTVLDEVCQRLIDCNFGLKEPELAMFTVALLNALGREARGERPTEVVLMLAFGASGTAERGRYRLMRWRRGEPGLGEQRDYRLGKMPLCRLPNSGSANKKVRRNDIQIQTAEKKTKTGSSCARG